MVSTPTQAGGIAALIKLVRHAGLRRFALFLMVGSVNFLFYYSLFTFLHFLEVPPTRAVVIATVIAVLFNFCTTGRVVFKSGNIRRLPRFIGVYAVQMGLNILGLRTLIAAGLPVLIAEALVIGVLAVLTFIALRFLVFNGVTRAEVAEVMPPRHPASDRGLHPVDHVADAR